MISHHHQCIFIHIPKTAGTSIEAKLGHFDTLERGTQDHDTIMDIEPLHWMDSLSIPTKDQVHRIYRRAKRRLNGSSKLTHEQYEHYFKFTFVRNPWARVFSWYKGILRDEYEQQKTGITPSCRFQEFVHEHLDLWALQPQLYWIRNQQNQIPLDFIGRFEQLERDFSIVCDQLQIQDSRLPSIMVSGNPSYIKEYDNDMKKIVAKKYAEEIDYFQYTFET